MEKGQSGAALCLCCHLESCHSGALHLGSHVTLAVTQCCTQPPPQHPAPASSGTAEQSQGKQWAAAREFHPFFPQPLLEFETQNLM